MSLTCAFFFSSSISLLVLRFFFILEWGSFYRGVRLRLARGGLGTVVGLYLFACGECSVLSTFLSRVCLFVPTFFVDSSGKESTNYLKIYLYMIFHRKEVYL